MMTNLGKWSRWYGMIPAGSPPVAYGSTESYVIGAKFLGDVDSLEDWGCGKGYFRTLVDPDRYRGIDGSSSPFVDEVADLAEYRSDVDGIFLRHVLEHDYRWSEILENAVESARSKIVIVLFTPTQRKTREIAWNEDPGVPDIGFRVADLVEILSPKFDVETKRIKSATQYGGETILLGTVAT